MSSIQQQEQQQQRHAKRDISCPPPLKINKDSHFIKKSSSSSSSSTSSLINSLAGPTRPQQQRHPVIIYTHSPKVIHTHPRDFMALVQKLTGLSRSEDDPVILQSKIEAGPDHDDIIIKTNNNNNNNNNNVSVGSDDNDSSSVITDENDNDNSSATCFAAAPMFEPASNAYMTSIPVFTPNSADFLCPNQPFYNYTDSLFFNPNMRSSISPSSTLDGIAEFREF